MNMWKGSFAPTFVKHHGGTLEDHIVLQDGTEAEGENWSLDGNILTATFHIETNKPNPPEYEAQWELTDEEVQDLADGNVSVEDLIADQLRLSPGDRTWMKPKKK